MQTCSVPINTATAEGQREYREVEECVLALQSLEDQMDPLAFIKTIKDIRGRANQLSMETTLRATPYKAAFLVKTLLMCDLLRNSGDLCDVLCHSIEILIPKVLWGPFKELLEVSRTILPDKSTVSRWRMLLDGAFMLFYRKHNAELLAGGSVRYFMADSSTQHGRDYEHIVVRTVRAAMLPVLLGHVQDLCDLWYLGCVLLVFENIMSVDQGVLLC